MVVGKGADGYTEGIPGPVTRLFVLANRGLANLIQDLILVSYSQPLLTYNSRTNPFPTISFYFNSASHKQANEW